MSDIHSELEKVIIFFQTELGQLQMGRASSSLVDHIEIEAYEQKQPLKNLAGISIPEPQQIVIEPWDKGVLQTIEKGIQEANLGFNPVVDGNIIRINIPPLNEERRKEIVKLVWKMAEEAKISVRNIRQDSLKKLKQQEKEIGEDQVKQEEKHIQEKIDETNKKIEEMAKKKEDDVMTV